MAVSSPSTTDGPGVEAISFDRKTTAVLRALGLFGLMPAMVVAVVVAVLVAPLVGLVAMVVVAAAWAGVVALRAASSLDRLLAALGAAPIKAGTAARWSNIVDGLGASSGVSEVELMLVDRPGANALAGASARRNVIVVTPELVDELNLVELEGVAANLLGRIKDGSARYGTVVHGTLAPFLDRVDAAGRLLADGLGPQRAVRTDLAAVGATRYPPGLASALEHLDRLGTEVPDVDPATAHLWIAPVALDGAGVDPAVAETAAQPLSYRVAVLQEL